MAEETGSVVRRLRVRAGLTQEGLADRSGVSVRTIRGLETGSRRNPQLASLVQLADALGLSAGERDELLTALGAAAPPVTARPVPRQLPAAPRGFAGRTGELAALERTGDGRSAAITVIVGAGGIGKTWLALQWAHDHLDRFPDGQLFADLRGFSPGGDPVEPLTVVRGFLTALGADPAELAGGPGELPALYRSRVAGKRMLIVLDNAATADQVTPLLPGTPGCTVLVTSRQLPTALLHHHGAQHVRLGVLAEADAHTLLAHRLGHHRLAAEPAATAALIRACGHHPLALSLVACRAQTGSGTPVGEFVTELREAGLDALDDADPAASLPDVLSWSLRSLTAEQCRAFALLGVAPGADIALPTAAHLVGLPPPRARKILRRLEDASLLGRHTHDRYLLHDLTRAYAATTAHESLAGDEIEAALHRVFAFYLHTAHAADRLLNPHGPAVEIDPPASGTRAHPLADATAALAWFDHERLNLLATLQTAAARSRHRGVWQLAETLNTYLRRRAGLDELLAVRRAAVDAATHLREHSALVLAHRRLGRTHAELGHHEEALHHLHRALAIAERQDEQAHVHRMLALAHGVRDDHRRALEHATQALSLFRAADDPEWQADAHNQVGWHAAHLGDHANAYTHCEAALAGHRQHGNAEAAADALTSLGYLAQHTGHHEQAIDHYEQALARYRASGNTRLAADTLARLGEPYDALRRHDEARAVRTEALEFYRRNGHTAATDRVQRQLDG
ncbi:tetratricopeptide repeat protein [Amycolatopsis sp. NPDC051102]|uniref:ATP-binding protein n=1 Tax=Amycolatopsis sp. NPDC051102 TaxID=3155163 RepID=UPI00342A5093